MPPTHRVREVVSRGTSSVTGACEELSLAVRVLRGRWRGGGSAPRWGPIRITRGASQTVVFPPVGSEWGLGMFAFLSRSQGGSQSLLLPCRPLRWETDTGQ